MRWSMIVEDHFTYWTDHVLRLLIEREQMQYLTGGSFGLGRDLVRPLDRIAAATRSIRRRGDRDGDAVRSNEIWDTHPAVLGIETAANAVIRALGGGVGLSATFRALP